MKNNAFILTYALTFALIVIIAAGCISRTNISNPPKYHVGDIVVVSLEGIEGKDPAIITGVYWNSAFGWTYDFYYKEPNDDELYKMENVAERAIQRAIQTIDWEELEQEISIDGAETAFFGGEVKQ